MHRPFCVPPEYRAACASLGVGVLKNDTLRLSQDEIARVKRYLIDQAASSLDDPKIVGRMSFDPADPRHRGTDGRWRLDHVWLDPTPFTVSPNALSSHSGWRYELCAGICEKGLFPALFTAAGWRMRPVDVRGLLESGALLRPEPEGKGRRARLCFANGDVTYYFVPRRLSSVRPEAPVPAPSLAHF